MNRFKWLTIGALVFFISGCTLYSPSSSSGSSDMSSASEDGDASTYGMGMGDNDSMEMLSDDSLSGSLISILIDQSFSQNTMNWYQLMRKD